MANPESEIQVANKLHRLLITHSTIVHITTREAYPNAEERTKARLAIDAKYDKVRHEARVARDMLCAYLGSTLDAMQMFSQEEDRLIVPSEAKKLWTILKANDRVFQIGGGRGKMLVIPVITPIIDEAEAPKLIDPTDPKALLRALQEQVVSSEADKETYQKEMETKEKELVEAKQQVRNLTAQVAAQTRTNWT